MKLREAIEKFEKERTSKDDYYYVYCLLPLYADAKCRRYLDEEEIKRCENVDVIGYEPFKGHVVNVALRNIMSADRECKAVNIELDPEQAEIGLRKSESRQKLLERLKESSDYALMYVDGVYCLVDTKNNKFIVIEQE